MRSPSAVARRPPASSALPIGRIKFLVYALTGALAGLGGVVVAARLSNGSPNAGQMMELDVIAAVVLGGTSLFGGSATMLGTIVGALCSTSSATAST